MKQLHRPSEFTTLLNCLFLLLAVLDKLAVLPLMHLEFKRKICSYNFVVPLKTYIQFQTIMGKTYTHFQTKRTQKSYSLGWHTAHPYITTVALNHCTPPPPLPLLPILNKTCLAWSVAGFYKPRLSPSPPELQVYLKLGQTLNSQHLLNLIKPTEKEVTTLCSTNRLIFVSRITIYTKK